MAWRKPGSGTSTWSNIGRQQAAKPKPPAAPSRGWADVANMAGDYFERPNSYVQPYLNSARQEGQSFPLSYALERVRLNQGGASPGTAPAYPGGGGSGGGGRGYGGGGGGGGGAGGITQDMIAAMAAALGNNVNPLQLQQTALPAFRGQALGAFNAAPYTQALGSINSAVTADQANIAANQQAVSQQLQSNYSNPYATAQVQAATPQQQQGAGLAGTVGGTVDPNAVQQANAGDANSQAAFQSLLQVLGAADQQSQNSRMAQVGMDANYGRQQLDASALGMRAGVGQAQANAQNQWQQQSAERNYQNSLMQQQWLREDMQRRQELQNQQRTANWTQQNQTLTARMQPILDLISQSSGKKLDFGPLMSILQGIR